MTEQELSVILDLHKKYLDGDPKGKRAALHGADLCGANLCGANLRGANLSNANLRGANLRNAILPNNIEWEEYLETLVPALCIAGGKTLEEVAATWDCHSWSNCPMHAAFSGNNLNDIPALYRNEAALFIQLFDAKLIPNPITNAAA